MYLQFDGRRATNQDICLLTIMIHIVIKSIEDNSSWFIVADFDEAKWADDCRTFLKICREYNIPAVKYLT